MDSGFILEVQLTGLAYAQGVGSETERGIRDPSSRREPLSQSLVHCSFSLPSFPLGSVHTVTEWGMLPSPA